MVRIVDYSLRTNREGDPFFALILQGGIVLVKSRETGQYYATAPKTSIPSTFDEATCRSLVGTEIDGTIERMDCDPYTVVNTETGETRELDYRYVYLKKGETVESFIQEARKRELVEELEL